MRVEPDRTRGETLADGDKMRRQVLGDAHVDRSVGQVSTFSKPIQDLVTEYCWGTIWTRAGLPPKIRSMINLAMLMVLNRQHEFGVHVRGALNNGVTVEEVQEILLQVAVYAGAPAALEAFRIAEGVINDYQNNV